MSEDSIRALALEPRDQGRWLAFYKKLRPAVYYSLYRACRGERELAEDLTQEAFERFFKHARLESFQNDAHVLAYLRQTARNALLNYLRRNRLELFANRVSGEEAPVPDSESEVQELEVRSDLETLFAGLEGADRRLFNRLMAGDSVQTIAKRLNLSYGATAVRIHRLLRKIRLEVSNLDLDR